ncbi:flagellar basal body rod protein FlgC [Sneathiella sp. P13V-1]|uniref:flagellar basal body rod protein FlgC n=1 Tax=Sneathiella sp. P13V-1 TaxID=2697366 RepID=UPI00187B1912|nr:flagellar basal body rod protein FlgC [Sneathiella sp. P13V-1]MBE7638371.1 flagellar basal body rod protein FlgC [Sneathiella sp. P13V-1]
MDLLKSMKISASGMKAQGERMRIISENLANKDSVGSTAEQDPYRRKVVTFSNVLDKEIDARKVVVDKVTEDKSEFGSRFDPNHPAANEEGYVKIPNVNALVEVMDMKETQRSYQANLGAIDASKKMIMQTLEILR